VDDFVTHIDRRPEPIERELDDLDGSVDSGAKAARGRDKHSQRGTVQHAGSDIRLRLQP